MLNIRFLTKVTAFIAALLLSFSLVTVAQAAQFMSVKNASSLSKSGKILLIDIRRPSEWKQDGIPKSGHAISMHRKSFLEKLNGLTKGNKNSKIALICATGARSSWLSGQLEAIGYTNIINVSEGMHGSQRGPGWLASKLPTKRVN